MSNKGTHGKLKGPNLGNSGLDQLVSPVDLHALGANVSKTTRAGQKSTQLIGGELPQQLLLLLSSYCTIDMVREQSDAIAKLGASPSTTPPSSNQGGKALKSLVPLAQPRRNL